MDDKVTTAAEMELLPMSERHRLAAEAIVTDVSQVPEDFLLRARQRGHERLQELGIDLNR